MKEFLKLLQPTENTTLLDVGFSEEEYSPNDNYFEKHYPWQKQMTALGTDIPVKFSVRYPLLKSVHYEGVVFPFADQSFDICCSNAVIEHVGGPVSQLQFLKELKRVGKLTFLTTPNRNFPVEVHTRTFLLHLLPKKMFEKYLRLTGREWATLGYMNLLTIGNIHHLLKEAGITDYRIIKNRFLFFVMDFVIIFKGTG